MSERRVIQAAHLGEVPYGEALRMQHRAHAAVAAEHSDGVILALEHPSVLTFGKNAEPCHLLESEAVLRQRGVDVVATERGGEVTAHMPGQLVLYPILPLTRLGIGVRAYVCALEEAVIRMLAGIGISAGRDPEHPGVWVGPDKVCALGVRIKERVSLHGLALNLTNDLSLFGAIVPCGIRGRGVTSLQVLTGRAFTSSEMAIQLVAYLAEILKIDARWVGGEALVANRGGTPYDAGPINIPEKSGGEADGYTGDCIFGLQPDA